MSITKPVVDRIIPTIDIKYAPLLKRVEGGLRIFKTHMHVDSKNCNDVDAIVFNDLPTQTNVIRIVVISHLYFAVTLPKSSNYNILRAINISGIK